MNKVVAAVVPLLIAAATSPVAAQSLVPASAAPSSASLVARLLGEAHAQRLAESRDWQVLLHYRRTTFGGWKSEADGDGFFLAGPPGRHDPAAELDADLKAFVAPAPAAAGDPHPQCRFPARWDWLKRALAIDARAVPDQPCPTFETWRTGISAGAVTLVYATAFLNSPASMYGHTFFRLSRTTAEGNRLLDYVVNFAADVDTDNGLMFAWKGVTGGFPGRFYVLPYYMKVQEYSNIESRDLWEYQLALSPEQVRRLVMHAWETRSTHFDYFFFTRNCSYYLLTLLEAAVPELHLIDQFPGSVIPSDTVRAVLKQPGLVVRTSPWPSLLSVMQQRKADLTRRELQLAEAWVVDPAVETSGRPQLLAKETLSKERQALVIDAAFDYLRYRDGLRAEPSDAFKRRERRMLVARGRLGVPPQELAVRPMVGAPEQGHDTFRLALGGGLANQSGPFQLVSVRGAIHDLLDPGRGYPADSRLEMGELRLRFDDRPRRLSLDRFDAVDILSASPLDRWVRTVSWKVWVGADNARELGCARPGSDRAGWRCLYGSVITGGGAAVRFGPGGRLLLSMLAETDLSVGPAFANHDDYRIGGGGEATLSGGAGERWRFEAGGRYLYYFLGVRGGVLRGRVAQGVMLSRMLSLRLAADVAGDFAQLGAEALAYF